MLLLVVGARPVVGQCTTASTESVCASQDGADKTGTAHTCKDSTTACFSDLAQWQKDSVVATHNKLREHHGSCPVTYSDTIAAWTKASAGFQTTCKDMKLTHNASPPKNDATGDTYGENIYFKGSQVQLQDWDPANGVFTWYCKEEACYDYNAAVFTPNSGHFTQVVWKQSTEVGCALCHVKGTQWTSLYFMCNYLSAGNYGGQFAANVLEPDTAPTGCPTPQPTPAPLPPAPAGEDECASSPCGAGGASGQTCADPDRTTGGTYVCTCAGDASVTALGKPAACGANECDAKPCGDGQTCEDPDTSAAGNYRCECSNGVAQTGAAAACESDECAAAAAPCGAGQTCDDPNFAADSLRDYVCTCTSDTAVTATGRPAACPVNECESKAKACGKEQTCADQDQFSENDFVCTCEANATLTRTGGPAACQEDECASDPCADGQTCEDPVHSFSSLLDYTCTCANKAAATGAKAECAGECAGTACGDDQACEDPDPSASSKGDFICTCGNSTRVGEPADCDVVCCWGSGGKGTSCPCDLYTYAPAWKEMLEREAARPITEGVPSAVTTEQVLNGRAT
eukprot:gene23440-biopygen6176